ncbi:putative bifunctional diguanylate cyclase/phosphodiesterase [Marinimicrobium sp. C2-29]|uniref:putative bifunctional diguanylate cyclase/phosphodiesterase n=1 Tax=Marinimicrobium sp. C2-29 TaxID=3139825 RepID=UPI003139A991
MNHTAYIPPEEPAHEEERLEELYGLALLDSKAERRFDRYTQLIADLFDFPVVLISLVDRDRQWFKSRLGWDLAEVPRDISFCGHALNQSSVMVVPDALEDPRFAGNPLVTGDPYIRFYAGAVVHGPSGQPLGTLCVIDRQPRHFDERQCDQLRQLADLVESEIAHSYDLQALRASVEFTAYYDPLTRLPNRRLLMDRLHQLLALADVKSLQVTVLLFNIAGLRLINQNLGTEGGDELLRQLGQRLTKHCPTGGTVARLQADELVMIFPVREPKQREAVIRRIHLALGQSYTCRGRDHYLRVQVGASLFPDQGATAEQLIEQASAAIRADHQGQPSAVRYFSREHSEALAERIKIESCLQKALIRNELYLLYQPIISLQSGEMIGVEALLRWDCPEMGLISPDRFIPMAEETGLILPIGRWVRNEACRQLRKWRSDPDWDIPIAINVSPVELARPEFAPELLQKLNTEQLPAELLWIEITEFSLLDDNSRVRQNLETLKTRSIRVNIDDFGTGYSSLSYLGRLSVNSLKIDRSFIDGLPEDTGGATLTRTIISMANALGLGQVAEGVENRLQLEFLRLHHCQLGQGYLISRPVAADQIPALRGRALV